MGLGAVSSGKLDYNRDRGTDECDEEHGAAGVRLQERLIAELHHRAMFVDVGYHRRKRVSMYT